MLKSMKLFLIILFLQHSAHASLLCKDLFRSTSPSAPSNTFGRLESLELELQVLMSQVRSHLGQSPSLDIQLTRWLQELSDISGRLENLVTQALDDRPVASSAIDSIRASMQNIERPLTSAAVETPQPMRTNTQQLSFESVLENPTSVVAEHIYTIQSAQNTEIRFLFSEKVVADLFSHPHFQAALKKSLKKIYLGIFGTKHEGSGIIKFDNYKGLVEIRFVGGGAGRLRIYGYFENGVLHFVKWSDSNEHSASRIARIADAIYDIWSAHSAEAPHR